MTTRSKPGIPFIAAMEDRKLFGPWFADPSWAMWKVVAKAKDGLALSAAEREVFAQIAGGRSAPSAPVREL